jgi:hypothetical protein
MFLQLHRVLNFVRESFQRSWPESWAESWSFGYWSCEATHEAAREAVPNRPLVYKELAFIWYECFQLINIGCKKMSKIYRVNSSSSEAHYLMSIMWQKSYYHTYIWFQVNHKHPPGRLLLHWLLPRLHCSCAHVASAPIVVAAPPMLLEEEEEHVILPMALCHHIAWDIWYECPEDRPM